MKEEEFEKFVFLEVLKNAVSFKGKASAKPIIGKVISRFPEVKNDIKYYLGRISQVVDQVNQWTLVEQVQKLKEEDPDFFKKSKDQDNRKRREGLPELPHVGDKVRLRFAPAPSGYLHIGHASQIIFNHEYVKRYGGEFILRIEDTNPNNIMKEAYDAIIEDITWLLGEEPNEIYFQSNRIEIYYDYARKLIEKGDAYVCTCDPEKYKELISNSAPCPCRSLSPEKNLERFNKMFSEYKPGEAVLRFKADLNNRNPALRDFPLMRIIDIPHVRIGNKYRVWPLYNLATAIDDSLMDVTHVIRGKDGEINGIRQDMLKDALGLRKCYFYHIGRTKFVDLELGKTPIKEKIEKGIYEGWDDPRVPTLRSFRRRGFLSEAFRKLAIAQGISKRDSKITKEDYMKSLIFFNKQIVDKIAHRYFFVEDPIEVCIENLDEFGIREIKVPRHPDHKEYGFRKFKIHNKVFVSRKDFDTIKNERYFRLMYLANFEVVDVSEDSLRARVVSIDPDKSLNAKVIHFLPELKHKVIIVMDDNSKLIGFGGDFSGIKVGSIIQFERFGFCRLDRIESGKYIFFFAHC